MSGAKCKPILKDLARLPAPPNLRDYAQACARFTWAEARARLDGLPGGRGLNIGHEAVDRHAQGARAARIALRFVSRRGARELSYAALREQTNRFANLLGKLGVGPGERVFSLLGRVPELYVSALGTLKSRSVFCPLFSAFGPEPLRTRLDRGDARVLVTTPSLYRRKVAGLREALPGLRHVLLVGDEPGLAGPGLDSFERRMQDAAPDFEIGPTDPMDPALLHFTSGTTGVPKGALHVHQAAVAHYATGLYALDFHDADVFWCTADPGWVTGTSYGILAPLLHGIRSVVLEEEFDAPLWYETLRAERVGVWYTAPTAIRMLMRAGVDVVPESGFPDLRFVASVGEPLDPEAVVWGLEAFGLPIHDNWWQTETGGIMIANYAACEIRPGSMGRPLPGVEAAIVRRREDGGVERIDAPEVEGELALLAGWPSMFRGYLGDDARYRKCFRDGWYLSGDLARRDADGYFWFVGRGDDVIKTAGHLIGPFEVESVLLEHPAVAGAAAIGVPDPVAGEAVKAFVVLRRGHEPTDALRLDVLAHARRRLGPATAPRAIEFRDALPHTRSGKIMRRLLRARELGLPEGDLSTLEEGA
ncbi:MAG TPA: acetate--CoA ligase [Myxococcota bacterium]|nr:acetate--CoA ligase [Myxococcota bacterium]